jgi:hypothetical protein
MNSETKFVFTPENLIDNLDKVGPWSMYALASMALEHYFPNEYPPCIESPSTAREAELLEKMGLKYWDDLVVKFAKEVGYKEPFNPEYVNEF